MCCWCCCRGQFVVETLGDWIKSVSFRSILSSKSNTDGLDANSASTNMFSFIWLAPILSYMWDDSPSNWKIFQFNMLLLYSQILQRIQWSFSFLLCFNFNRSRPYRKTRRLHNGTRVVDRIFKSVSEWKEETYFRLYENKGGEWQFSCHKHTELCILVWLSSYLFGQLMLQA